MATALISTEARIETLRKCEFLQGLKDSVLSDLAAKAEILSVDCGKVIVTRGESGSTMYFIISGSVRVHHGEVVLANIGTGDVFGEYSVCFSYTRLEYMFTYMNTARIGIAIQGLCHSELVYQISLPYAKERLSMRSLSGTKQPEKEADAIIVHPDVRKMLLKQKAFSEGGRAMVYYAGKIIDELMECTNEQDKEHIDDKLGFFTPILKGFLTEVGIESANNGLQVLGGHGYIKEWGLEQIVRDARISTLYEGTTGIQGLDLLGRKVLLQRGKTLKGFSKEILSFCKSHSVISNNEHKFRMNKFIWPLSKAVINWQRYSLKIALKARKNRDYIGSASVDFLMYSGCVTMANFWAMMAQKANEKIAEKPENIEFYQAKVRTAEFYFEHIFPRTRLLAKTMLADPKSLMRISCEQF